MEDRKLSEKKQGSLPVADIVKTDKALREVDRDSPDYEQLVASVVQAGITTPISVRLTEEGIYELIDGRHRLTAAQDAGLDMIPCIIYEGLSEADHLDIQIIANTHRAETKPAQYANQLKRRFALDPNLTAVQVATNIGRTVHWVTQILRLNRLAEAIQERVDDGTISLSNAVVLAQLPEDEQEEWVERAISQTSEIFVPECTARIKEIKDAARKGRSTEAPQFTPMAKLRKVGIIKEELVSGDQASQSSDPNVFAAAIKWVLQMDDVTVDADRAKWEERKASQAEEKKNRELQRAEAKEKKAASDAAKVREEMNE